MKANVVIPVVGESITEVTVGKWLKKDGDPVTVDEVLCEIESEKATIEVVAEQAGRLQVLVSEGKIQPIGAVIATIDTEANAVVAKAPTAGPIEAKTEVISAPPATQSPTAITPEKKIRATPVAERIMQTTGIDSTTLTGSGPGGKIIKSDVTAALKSTPAEAGKNAVPTLTDAGDRPERRERMSTLRKTISRRLVAAKNETAMLTTINEIDMSAILALRAKFKDGFQERYNVRLGFMSFFVKAVCLALKEYPVVNAGIEGDEIVYHDYCDIGIAVAAPRGLVVPIVRNAEKLSLAAIEQQIAYLADRARDNKLSIEEMTGGTFSITNGGVFGSLISTPIINVPQSAILGMHTIQERPVAINSQVVIRPMMYVSLSYDHRIIDGRESVLFLVRVKQLLEEPARMLMEI